MLSDPAKIFLSTLRRIERESKLRAKGIDAACVRIRREDIHIAVNNAKRAINWNDYK